MSKTHLSFKSCKISLARSHIAFFTGLYLFWNFAYRMRVPLFCSVPSFHMIAWLHKNIVRLEIIFWEISYINHHSPLPDQFHIEFMRSYLKFCKHFHCYNYEFHYPIRSQFCTFQDSWAVLTCAKLWAVQIIIFQVIAPCIFTRFRLWAHKPSV